MAEGTVDILPPHNMEMEWGVLGMLLIHNEMFDQVSSILSSDDFYEKAHGRLYEIMGAMRDQGKPFDPASLKSCLKEINPGPNLTILQWLFSLVKNATTAINAAGYSRAIVDLHKRRKLLAAADEIKALVCNSSYADPLSTLVDEATALLDDVRSRNGVPEGLISFGDAMGQSIDALAKAFQNEGNVAGRSTGFPTLNEAFGGLSSTDVIIIAGRPGSGKSALAVDIASHVAKDDPSNHVLFFSQEMAAQQLTTRALSKKSKIPAVRLRNGNIEQSDFENLVDIAKGMADLSIIIDESAGIKLSHVASKLRQISRRKKVSVVVVDYLQLMAGGGKSKGRGDNRNQELSEITAGLKTLAKQFGVCFIVLSQLSREVEKRDDKRPILSDLRDSGSIEQDADIVMMVYREEYYLKQRFPHGQSGDQWEKWKSDMDRWKGLAEIIIAKNRHGPQGTFLLGFDGDTTSFRELEEDEKQGRNTEQPKAKVRLIKSAALVFDAMVACMARLGQPGRCPNAAMDMPAILTSEAFGEYLASRPSMDGDNAEKAEKEAREQFKKGMIWLHDEGVIVISNETSGETKRAWLWFTGRKVRR